MLRIKANSLVPGVWPPETGVAFNKRATSMLNKEGKKKVVSKKEIELILMFFDVLVFD